jgi:hypothetical protein
MTIYFETLTSEKMASLVVGAERTVCLAAPGLQDALAHAIAARAAVIGPELMTVCVDFDERVLRMGFGSLRAIEILRGAGISVTTTPGLRMGLLIVDELGFAFTPTALLLEGEKSEGPGMNAMRLLPAQAKEAMARLSPAAKAVALVLAKTEEERQALREIQVENTPAPIQGAAIEAVSKAINLAPLVKFDVARQVRVYNAFLQYVKVELKNASIDRKRVAIPASILALGGTDRLNGRLKATFDLIEKSGVNSSAPLTRKVKELRENFTPSIGGGDNIILKSQKPRFEERVEAIRTELAAYQAKVAASIEAELTKSKEAIINYYEPIARQNPPDAAHGLFGSDVRAWLKHELQREFPSAESLVSKMALDVEYKDVTYETLQSPKFLNAVRKAIPWDGWDKAHEEYRAAGETEHTDMRG